MFEEVYTGSKDVSIKRWSLSIILAVICYFSLFYTISILKGTVSELPKEERKVDVDFVEEIIKKDEPEPAAQEESKPPAPVVPQEMKEVEPAAPSFIPEGMKVVEVDKLAAQELLAPTSVPDASPKEADPSMDKGVMVYGKYDPEKGDPLGVEGGNVESTTINIPEPVRLPEKAIPPQPLKNNPPPEYPPEARNKGVSGVVLLKIIIDAYGNVGKVEVLRGEEPFISSAVKAVEKWKYKPAYYQNKPITIYHIIKIPFTLKTG